MKHIKSALPSPSRPSSSKRPSRQARSFLTLLVWRRLHTVVFAALAMAVLVINMASPVFAAVSYGPGTVVQKASYYEDALILKQCLAMPFTSIQQDLKKVEAGQVADNPGGSWAVWDQTIIKYHQTLQDEDNIMSCGEYDDALVKGAIKRLKIDPIDFVCYMGAIREDGSDCVKGDGNFLNSWGESPNYKYATITEPSLIKYIKARTGLDLNNPGDEVRYQRSYNIVQNYCTLKDITKDVYDAKAKDSQYTYTDPSTDTTIYRSAKSKKSEKPRYTNTKGEDKGEQGTVTCQTYLDRMEQYYPAYRVYMSNLDPDKRQDEDNARNENEDATNGTTEAASCNPDLGIGWLLCPTVNFLAGIGDNAKGFIDEAMTVNTLDVLPLSGGANDAWKTMRDIANVMFVIAFLFMIYSQLTGFGLSNYALKKMLPRLIVAAILINASYYICVAGVELSNVLGQGLDQLISAGQCGGGDICVSVTPPENSVGAAIGQNLVGIATAALAIGIGVTFFLPQVIAIVVYVAFIAIAAAVLLGVRQALIILLVIVSPIAFAAYLLPNTESIFKKWWAILKALLLLYPIFGLLYGAGKLAAGILGNTGNTQLQLFGYVALFSGLLLLPKLLEGALAVGGLSAIVSKFSNKAQGATNNKLQDVYGNSSLAKGREMRKQGRQAWRNKKFAEAMAGEDPSRMGRLRRRFGRGVTGVVPFGSHIPTTEKQDYVAGRIETAALSQYDKEFEESVHGAGLTMANATNAEIAKTFKNGGTFESKEHAAAAIDRIMSSGSAEERKHVLTWLGSQKAGSAFDSRSLRSRAVNGSFKRGDSGIYGSGFANKFIDGSVKTGEDINKEIVDNAAGGKLTGQTIVSSDSGAKVLVDAINERQGAGYANAQVAADKVRTVARDASTTDATKAGYTESIDKHINRLGGGSNSDDTVFEVPRDSAPSSEPPKDDYSI